MRVSLAALFLVTAIAPWQPDASAADPPKQAYLLFPIRTQLQQEVFFHPNERYYLMVHGESLLDGEGKLDASQLDFDSLTDDIGRIREVRPGDKIRSEVFYAKEPPRAGNHLLNLAILGWACDSGYEPHSSITFIGDGDWKAAVKITDDARGLSPEKGREDAVGDEDIRVYPVRTALSRLRSNEAECVISFRRPYGKDASGTLDEKARARIKELVDSLKLKERKRVQFGIRVKVDGNEKAADRFIDKTAQELSDELGFKCYGVLHSGGW